MSDIEKTKADVFLRMEEELHRLQKVNEALLVALQNLVGAITIKNPDIQNNIDDAYKAIARAEGKL